MAYSVLLGVHGRQTLCPLGFLHFEKDTLDILVMRTDFC